MKNILVIILITGISVTAAAQDENRSERLITQLKKGTAPGLRFAPETNAPEKKEKAVEQKESLIAQIRKGTAPNLKFMQSSGANAGMRSTPAAEIAKPGALASDQPVNKEALKTEAVPIVVPKQEETKQEKSQ